MGCTSPIRVPWAGMSFLSRRQALRCHFSAVTPVLRLRSHLFLAITLHGIFTFLILELLKAFGFGPGAVSVEIPQACDPIPASPTEASQARAASTRVKRPVYRVWMSALNKKQLHGSEVLWVFHKVDLGWFPSPPKSCISSDDGPSGTPGSSHVSNTPRKISFLTPGPIL